MYLVCRLLLYRGAIIDICNNDRELPIDLIEDNNILNYLKNEMKIKGIDEQQARNFEHRLMFKHAQDIYNNNHNNNNESSLIDVKTGATPLHVAAAKGYLDVIQ